MTTYQFASRLAGRKLPPGCRPAGQTRASPPHPAKNGLDAGPGVWANVCMDSTQTSRKLAK